MSMLEDAKSQLKLAYKYAEIDNESWERLQYPQRTVQVAIPMRHDDGTLKIYRGYRCQYDATLGPTKGGVRFHPEVTRDHCETLAFLMVCKNAVTATKFGGSKGGVVVDTKTLSHRELERLSKAYMAAIADFIGPDIDIPAPDMGTDERIMGWMYSEYRKIKGGHPLDIITGKPVALGGIEGRNSATGYGGYYVLEHLMANYQDRIKLPPKNEIRMAIQGFGKVGYWFAEKCYKNGIKIVAISNENGGIYDENGLSPILLLKHLETNGELGGQGTKITNEELLQLNVDILAPAAIESAINVSNVKKIKARCIFELANSPITNEANITLDEQKTVIIPDILANAGGVVVSYFEWLQNRTAEQKTLEEVNNRLKSMMYQATEKTMVRHTQYEIPIRTACYALALKRIGEANECLGNRNYFRK